MPSSYRGQTAAGGFHPSGVAPLGVWPGGSLAGPSAVTGLEGDDALGAVRRAGMTAGEVQPQP